MTKLEAASEILRAIGRGQVSALDTNGASDVAMAERILDESELQVQAEGYFYNLRRRLELTPDSAGHIELPEGAIVVTMEWCPPAQQSFTQLGRRLYDLCKKTDVWDGSVKAIATLRYDFDCIPYPIQKYITRIACERFNEQYGGGSRGERRQYLAMETQRAKALANRFNDRASGANILNTAGAELARGQRLEYRR